MCRWDVSSIDSPDEWTSDYFHKDYRWKYEYTRDILTCILEQTLSAEAPKYETILELDRKVREKPLPPHLNVFMTADEEECTPSVYMRRCLLGQYRSVSEYLEIFAYLSGNLILSQHCSTSIGVSSPKRCWTIPPTHFAVPMRHPSWPPIVVLQV